MSYFFGPSPSDWTDLSMDLSDKANGEPDEVKKPESIIDTIKLPSSGVGYDGNGMLNRWNLPFKAKEYSLDNSPDTLRYYDISKPKQ